MQAIKNSNMIYMSYPFLNSIFEIWYVFYTYTYAHVGQYILAAEWHMWLVAIVLENTSIDSRLRI